MAFTTQSKREMTFLGKLDDPQVGPGSYSPDEIRLRAE